MSITVERVTTASGSHIEPPLQQYWSSLRKLRWWAAVAEADEGIAISVEKSQYWINNIPQFGYFDVAGSGPMRFDAAWTFINGMCAGARASTRVTA